MDMFTDNLNLNNSLMQVTEQEFWDELFKTDQEEIKKDSQALLAMIDEIVSDKLGSNMSVTYGIVNYYDESEKKAQVELITTIDYTISILDEKRTMTTTEIKQNQTIDNLSIFHPLKKGDGVIIVKPQGRTESNGFIIGVLQPSKHKSLYDECLELKEKIKMLESKVDSLNDKIASLSSSKNSVVPTSGINV